jgi:hypothetical protein
VARIEQGAASRLTVGTLERVAAAVGARVVCRLSWNGEALDRLLDESHADVVERTVRLLQASGWVVATEVSFNFYCDRGAVDILAFHAATAVLLVVEVKSVVPDLLATLATLDRKVRLGRPIASTRGWTPRAVAALLVIRDDRTSRRRVAAHAATLQAAYPGRGRAVRSWLAAPNRSAPMRGLLFVTSDHQAVTGQRVRRRSTVRRASSTVANWQMTARARICHGSGASRPSEGR